MSLVDGRIVIDKEKCDGCGDCAKEDVCPQGLIRMIPRDATNFIPCSSTEEDDEVVRKTCGYGCIACGECERACPEGAVSIIDNHAVIDYDKCVGCVACAVKCKKKIIVDTLHDLTALKSTVAFVRCSGDGRIAFQLKNAGITTCQEAAKAGSQVHGTLHEPAVSVKAPAQLSVVTMPSRLKTALPRSIRTSVSDVRTAPLPVRST